MTAEIRGGLWKSAPVSVCRARGRAAGFSREEWSRSTQTYSFPERILNCDYLRIMKRNIPAPCCDFTKRVARSMQTMRHPVTFLVVDLYVVPEELLESCTVKDTIFGGLVVVYNESVLDTSLSGLSSSNLRLVSPYDQPTEKVTQQS